MRIWQHNIYLKDDFRIQNMLVTILWFFRAVNKVFGDMYETLNVDASREMNDIHRMILSKTSNEIDDLPAGYAFRLQLPRDAAVINFLKHFFREFFDTH